MILDSVTQLNIYHNNSGNHNKVWGHFFHGEHVWAFWGGVGKAWSFKYHGPDSVLNNRFVWDLAEQKVRKGYDLITALDLDVLDPDWRDRFNERFTYFLLQQTPL
jgi:hypothetical protein